MPTPHQRAQGLQDKASLGLRSGTFVGAQDTLERKTRWEGALRRCKAAEQEAKEHNSKLEAEEQARRRQERERSRQLSHSAPRKRAYSPARPAPRQDRRAHSSARRPNSNRPRSPARRATSPVRRHSAQAAVPYSLRCLIQRRSPSPAAPAAPASRQQPIPARPRPSTPRRVPIPVSAAALPASDSTNQPVLAQLAALSRVVTGLQAQQPVQEPPVQPAVDLGSSSSSSDSDSSSSSDSDSSSDSEEGETT